MTFGHSHELLVVPLQGFGGVSFFRNSKTSKCRGSRFNNKRHASRIRISGTVIVCCPLAYATPRHRAPAEVFATDPSKLNQQFGHCIPMRLSGWFAPVTGNSLEACISP
jgi:hypothetical protein